MEGKLVSSITSIKCDQNSEIFIFIRAYKGYNKLYIQKYDICESKNRISLKTQISLSFSEWCRMVSLTQKINRESMKRLPANRLSYHHDKVPIKWPINYPVGSGSKYVCIQVDIDDVKIHVTKFKVVEFEMRQDSHYGVILNFREWQRLVIEMPNITTKFLKMSTLADTLYIWKNRALRSSN